MNYITYENYHNPHVMIHRENCSEPHKRGGYENYNSFNSLAEAERYARSLSVPMMYCKICKPTS